MRRAVRLVRSRWKWKAGSRGVASSDVSCSLPRDEGHMVIEAEVDGAQKPPRGGKDRGI